MVGVNSGGSTFLRPLSKEDPIGKWHRVSGQLTQVDAADNKVVGVKASTKVAYYRRGITPDKPVGTSWEPFGQGIIQIAIGDGKILGINTDFNVVIRTGITADDPHGKSWTVTGGLLKQIRIGNGQILGLTSDNIVYYRFGVDQQNPYGTDWRQLGGRALEQIEIGGGRIVGVDASGHVWYRWGLSPSQPFGKGWKTTVGSFKHISANERMIAGVEYGGSEVFFCHANTFPHS